MYMSVLLFSTSNVEFCGNRVELRDKLWKSVRIRERIMVIFYRPKCHLAL